MSNQYTPAWFSMFHDTIPATQTENEAAFIARHLPQPAYKRVLDLCCGQGRHASLLADKGYQVVGVDILASVLEKAKQLSGDKVTYFLADMRAISDIPGTFNAVLSIWQSFGFFDTATNTDILRQICNKLDVHGRLLLDIVHKGFIEKHLGDYTIEKDGRRIIETKTLLDSRLTTRLNYGDGNQSDIFEWEIFTPEEICERLAPFNMKPIIMCSGFDEQKPPTDTNPRMQLIFEIVK